MLTVVIFYYILWNENKDHRVCDLLVWNNKTVADFCLLFRSLCRFINDKFFSQTTFLTIQKNIFPEKSTSVIFDQNNKPLIISVTRIKYAYIEDTGLYRNMHFFGSISLNVFTQCVHSVDWKCSIDMEHKE